MAEVGGSNPPGPTKFRSDNDALSYKTDNCMMLGLVCTAADR